MYSSSDIICVCPHRTVDNSKEFGRNLVVAYYDVDYVKNAKGTNYWRNRVMKVAKNFPSLRFAVSNKDDFMQEVNEFGIGMITGDKPKVIKSYSNKARLQGGPLVA